MMRRARNTFLVLMFMMFCAFLGQNFTPFRHSFDRKLTLKSEVLEPQGAAPTVEGENSRYPMDAPPDLSPGDTAGDLGLKVGFHLARSYSHPGSPNWAGEWTEGRQRLEEGLAFRPGQEGLQLEVVKGTGSRLSFDGSIRLRCDVDYSRQKLELHLLEGPKSALTLERALRDDKSSVQWKVDF